MQYHLSSSSCKQLFTLEVRSGVGVEVTSKGIKGKDNGAFDRVPTLILNLKRTCRSQRTKSLASSAFSRPRQRMLPAGMSTQKWHYPVKKANYP
eukprot:scaffold47855_cov38-Cyclotella_meneghiniana.AAC.1